MTDSRVSNQFFDLIDEGRTLLESNLDFTSDVSQKWKWKCVRVLETKYGRSSDKCKTLKRAGTFDVAFSILETIANNELDERSKHTSTPSTHITNVTVSQTQTSNIQNEVSLQIMLNIEHSTLPENQKEEAKELLNEVATEVKQENPNWDKVVGLLKKSFDYGLKIAPDIVKLADAYYRAKGSK